MTSALDLARLVADGIRVGGGSDLASVTADTPIGGPMYPPRSWFTDIPEGHPDWTWDANGITVVTGGPDKGRAFGVPYDWTTLVAGTGRTFGPSPTSFAHFYNGNTHVTCEDGGKIGPVGSIPLLGGHAPRSIRLAEDAVGWRAANEPEHQRLVGRLIDVPEHRCTVFLGYALPEMTHGEAALVNRSGSSGDQRYSRLAGRPDQTGPVLVTHSGQPRLPIPDTLAAALAPESLDPAWHADTTVYESTTNTVDAVPLVAADPDPDPEPQPDPPTPPQQQPAPAPASSTPTDLERDLATRVQALEEVIDSQQELIDGFGERLELQANSLAQTEVKLQEYLSPKLPDADRQRLDRLETALAEERRRADEAAAQAGGGGSSSSSPATTASPASNGDSPEAKPGATQSETVTTGS